MLIKILIFSIWVPLQLMVSSVNIGSGVLVIVFVIQTYLILNMELSIRNELEQREDVWKKKEASWLYIIEEFEKETLYLSSIAKEEYRGRTLTLDTDLILEEYIPNDKHAIVTMIGFPNVMHPYWMGAIGLIQSLRESKTRVPHIVVMVRNNSTVPHVAIDVFDKLNVEIINIDSFDLDTLNVDTPTIWGNAFDKLKVWGLTQFEKILFLDADTLVVQNIDHLLMEPELTSSVTPKLCDCKVDYDKFPHRVTLGSGFFVCEPSKTTLEEFLVLASNTSPDPDDLEQYGGTWHWGDQEMLRVKFNQLSDKWNRLPWQYDVPVGTCGCNIKKNSAIYSYHFVCTKPISKPWYDPLKPLYYEMEQHKGRPIDCIVEIYNLWFRMFAKGCNIHK